MPGGEGLPWGAVRHGALDSLTAVPQCPHRLLGSLHANPQCNTGAASTAHSALPPPAQSNMPPLRSTGWAQPGCMLCADPAKQASQAKQQGRTKHTISRRPARQLGRPTHMPMSSSLSSSGSSSFAAGAASAAAGAAADSSAAAGADAAKAEGSARYALTCTGPGVVRALTCQSGTLRAGTPELSSLPKPLVAQQPAEAAPSRPGGRCSRWPPTRRARSCSR